jgi:hypothetical protein
LIEWFKTFEGVEFMTMEQVCDDFKAKHPPEQGAILPAEAGLKLREGK